MKFFLFICYLILAAQSDAQTLLVPHPSANLEVYLNKCKMDGYQCTQDHVKNLILNTSSEAFANFIETVDLYDKDYQKNLFYKIKTLISEEHLSLNEIDLLIKIIQRFESISKSSELTQIKNELIELSTDLKNRVDERSDKESFVLFKTTLSKTQYDQIKYKIRSSMVTRITPYTVPHRTTQASIPLISGECENVQFAPLITQQLNLKYTAFFNSECATTAAYSSTTNGNFNFHDYKMPLIYSVAGLALLSFFSQYKVEVDF